MWIAGADGCKAGWVVVLRRAGSDELRVRVVDDARALLSLAEQPAALGVDMPIGLLDEAQPGGRACDQAARQMLKGRRGSSVFSPPVRAALAADDYDAALAANRQSSEAEIGISKQVYNLGDKIRQLDALLTPEDQDVVREVHPEVSFAAMNGGAGLPESKKTAKGQARRRALLAAEGFPLPSFDVLGAGFPSTDVALDDLLDACAACWTAGRIARGEAQRLPQNTRPRDAHDLRMEIWR